MPKSTQNAIIKSSDIVLKADKTVVEIVFEFGDGNQIASFDVGFLGRLLEDVLEVDKLSKIQGRPVRVILLNEIILTVGHYLRPCWLDQSTVERT